MADEAGRRGRRREISELYDMGDIPGLEVPLPPREVDQPPFRRVHRVSGGVLLLMIGVIGGVALTWLASCVVGSVPGDWHRAHAGDGLALGALAAEGRQPAVE